MTKPGPEPSALLPFIKLLLEQVRELHARSEALRCLLESRGVFSRDEYEKLREEALSLWDQTMTAEGSRALMAASDEALQRLLEKHKGTEQ